MRTPPRSLRARLALLFAIGSGALLVASAAFLYVNLDRQLQSAVDRGLAQRADDIASDIRGGAFDVRQPEAFAEILDSGGRVLGASPTIPDAAPVLTPAEVRRALTHPVYLDRADVPGLGDTGRLLARPVDLSPATVVVVVGTSRDAIDRAQSRLALVLAVASPLLVGALAGGGWMLAGAALRPVERMTEEADAISLSEVGRRLPIPPGEDELTHLGRTLNAMLDRIEASFARERAFVDDASHELRTPISILRGELELALMTPDLSPDVSASLSSALEEAERLGRLANDLLSLARATAGTLTLRPERVDVRELTETVVDRLRMEGGPPVDVSGVESPAVVDRSRLEQVVTNLVTNARRHARRGVQVSVVPAGSGVDLVVADDGPGFPPELLPVVFDRFTRADPARGRDADSGAGLGLAIAAAIVHAHRGTIRASNGPPLGGAVVHVHLPASVSDRAGGQTDDD